MQASDGTGYASNLANRIFEAQNMLEAKPKDSVMQKFDTEFLFNAPEIYVFAACRHIVEQVLTIQGQANAGEISASRYREWVNPLFLQLRGLAGATERFDIVFPVTSDGAFSPYFWYDYRQSLSPKKLKCVHRLQDTYDPAALDYRPAGHWVNYRAAPALDADGLNASQASSDRGSD
jgi:hypothetical protein